MEKTRLNGEKMIKVINNWAMPIIQCIAEIIN